jgi:RNA polymerase sigma-70 factor (ECF subfamily)
LAHVLEHRCLSNVSPDKGRFRSFLIISLKNFLSNDRDRARAQKRGGKFEFVSWESAQAGKGYRVATAMELTPDKAFERTWATMLLEQVLARLRDDYAATGKAHLYEALQGNLTADGNATPNADLREKLNLGESALKMAIHRLRRRFGELLRAEIAQTVASPEEIDQEIRALFAALRV